MSRILIFSACLLFTVSTRGADVSVDAAAQSPQAAYAQRRLEQALAARPDLAGPDSLRIVLAIDPRLGPEAFRIASRASGVSITGGDARGLIYGALEARDQLRNGLPPARWRGHGQTPRLPFRAIKLNTPWDSYRASSALAQHTATMRDLAFWEDWLDMMVENRFNAFTLWTLHPFTYMIRPKDFPEASPWSDAEFAQWQQLYRDILRLAKERGLDTYVVFWSIFVSEPFARAHNPASRNFYPHYYVDGDTSEITRRYLRDSVTQMLVEYPDLDGIGVSHGEGMGGMTPLERQRFVDEVYVAGALAARPSRPVKLIHRVPFSSGLSSGPGVSADVEKITRAAMEKLGDQFAGPIWVEMKFNWSHGHSTPTLVKVHGGKLGDTYFNPPPSNYRVVWQVRNEDFFALRWGSPEFVARHLAQNGQAPHVGGYFVGSETYIPALDYFSAQGGPQPPEWRWAFQRQWLFYQVWGRLLYDPKTPPQVFIADFERRYPGHGRRLFEAFRTISRTPLELASVYDSRWDFTLYSEGMLALQGEVTRYIGVEALMEQPTLDPTYLSVKDFVRRSAAGERWPRSWTTPPELAARLQARSEQALALVRDIDPGDRVALLQEVTDVRAWAYLGLHLAEKLRGAVELQRFRRGDGEAHRQAAVAHLTRALAWWDELVRVTRPVYRDMPLAHYNHNSFDANPDNLFHWARLRADVARDVDVAKQAPVAR